jgi:hypothetical protein
MGGAMIYLGNSLATEGEVKRLHVAWHMHFNFLITGPVLCLQRRTKTTHRCVFAMHENLERGHLQSVPSVVGAASGWLSTMKTYNMLRPHFFDELLVLSTVDVCRERYVIH